jgi:hypothetical protein
MLGVACWLFGGATGRRRCLAGEAFPKHSYARGSRARRARRPARDHRDAELLGTLDRRGALGARLHPQVADAERAGLFDDRLSVIGGA